MPPTTTPNDNAATTTSNPPFYDKLHAQYIQTLSTKLDNPSSYEGAMTEHLRMSGIYWSLTALSILRSFEEVDQMMNVTGKYHPQEQEQEEENDDQNNNKDKSKKNSICIVDWVMACYHPTVGGFSGNIGHDPHLLYTLSAIQILALADRLDDERYNKQDVAKFVQSLQQPDGSFAGDAWGEVDTRFSYCAISTLSILGFLQPLEKDGPNESDGYIHLPKAVQYITTCQNPMDGGYGCIPGAESHAGQIFCCVGALAIAQALPTINTPLLCWWLAERQCDSGGLNGRPEKQADVCYSWWILSSLAILGRMEYIRGDKLAEYILKCQDEEDGGIADRPQNMADVFHTFFGISGLSLLGCLKHDDGEESEKMRVYRKIDPLYALPTDVVKRLNLGGQVRVPLNGELDERLTRYTVLPADK